MALSETDMNTAMDGIENQEQIREECRQRLCAQDSIMEPNVADIIAAFIQYKGQPSSAVAWLSESYEGVAEMCNIASEWATSMNFDPQDIMQNSLKALLVQNFDAQQVDSEFMSSQSAPSWLNNMIEDSFWRQAIYELSEIHNKCSFLKFAIQKISDAGYQQEMAKVSTASTFLNVFNGVLYDFLKAMITKDDIDVDRLLPEFKRACLQNEHKYVYAQVLLSRLTEVSGGSSYQRIQYELERNAAKQFKSPFVDIFGTIINKAPQQLVDAKTAIMQGENPTPGDVIQIYKLYTQQRVPSLKFLRDAGFIDKLIQTAFLPSQSGVAVKPEIKERVIHLLAIAAAATEDSNGSLELSDVPPVTQSLKRLDTVLAKKSTGADLETAVGDLLMLLDHPMVALAVVHWLDSLLADTTYYETYFRTTDIPLPHLLLEEIASRHPMLQKRVFQVLKKNVEMNIKVLGPEIMMALRRTLLDRMIYLVQLGYAIPILEYIRDTGDKLDESLIIHSVQRVLEMADEPYSQEFVSVMVDIVDPISDNLDKSMDVKTVIWQFFNTVLKNSENFDQDTLEKIRLIQRKG
ncbi:hypothetical protein BZG36_01368 [Bifiguratus adelaidae]|uniref:TH1 protein n=1 Tax=Bifiguratus adelaidae TaxID=1938954 RepID=A0A261Y3C0_9FUNG|nr:hypothetical protein BZG36_01368 [Bifiguratus adelaidae]